MVYDVLHPATVPAQPKDEREIATKILGAKLAELITLIREEGNLALIKDISPDDAPKSTTPASKIRGWLAPINFYPACWEFSRRKILGEPELVTGKLIFFFDLPVRIRDFFKPIPGGRHGQAL